MSLWVVVFARAGSKGLPGKNLMSFGGIPLVARAILVGRAVDGVDAVLCSTDSEEIALVAKDHGAIVPFMRPPELADDKSPEWLSWKHLARHLLEGGAAADDLLVSLPPTSPLRVVSDVESAILKLSTSEADVAVSYTPAARSPWFNMVTENEDGFLSVVIDPNQRAFDRRQDTPRALDLATVVYVTTLGYIASTNRMFDGRVVGVEVPADRAIDIDTQLDFDIAEFLLKRGIGGN